MTDRAIDVSRWNGNVNYGGVKKAGIDYVIIQCGYGMMKNQKDPYFEKNYKNAKKAGLKVGVYHYSYAKSLVEIRKEAKVCLSWIKGKSFELPIYIDMEENSLASLGKAALTKMAKEYCRLIEKAGYTAGVYANSNWFKNYLNYNEIKKDYSIWLAQYASDRDFECDIWQYSDNGRIRENAGLFDMNYVYRRPIIRVKTKKNIGLYKYAYTDPVGKSSTKLLTVKKGRILQWISDDGFGWSKVKYNGDYYYVVNSRLSRKGLSAYPKKKLAKDTKMYLEKKGKLSKAVIMKKGKTVTIVCVMEKGKYKGYSYISRGGKSYYAKL